MQKIYTTKEVAEILGLSIPAINLRARVHNIGTKVNSHMRVYTEEDLQAMQDIPDLRKRK